jgi:HD-like signal output (HDOD) protein
MSDLESRADRRSPEDFLRHIAAKLDTGIVELPAFPQVVIKVQAILKDPNYTAQMIAAPIASDPTLANRLLNLANSAAFNATGKVIINLGVALTRLGTQKVYSVVLAHAIQAIRRTESLRSVARPLDELWSESVAVAHFCDAIAKRKSLPAQDAFVAGLLHLIGRFYILVQYAEQDPSRPRVVLSDELVSAWHPRIAVAVLKNWHMSEAVCEAVGSQAEVLAVRMGPPTLHDVLIVGIRLAKRLKNTHDTSSLSLGGVLARLDLSVEACNSLIAEAAAEVRALERGALHA